MADQNRTDVLLNIVVDKSSIKKAQDSIKQAKKEIEKGDSYKIQLGLSKSLEQQEKRRLADSLKQEKAINIELDKQAKLKQKISLFQEQQNRALKKFELGKFSDFADKKQLEGFRKELNGLSVDTPNVTDKMKTLSSQFSNIRVEAQSSRQGFARFADEIKNSGSKFLEFYAIGGLIVSAMGAVTSAVSTVYELDNALTEFKLVTMATDAELQGLTKSMTEFANANAVTVLETAKVTTSLARQGLSGAELDKRREAIVKFAKISGLSFEESERAVTSSANGTKEEVDKIIDVYAKLGDATASGSDEIALAVSRTASSAELSGVKFEKLAGIISTLSSITRESSSVIGSSFKSILARYGSIKEQGFNEEDATKINDVVKALSSIGVVATDSAGQLRPFEEVLDEVGKKFNNLDRNTQGYIATTLGGTFQSNRLITVLSSYDEVLKNTEFAMNSAGSATQKFNIYLESSEAKVAKLKASLDNLWINTLSSGFLKSLIDIATALVNVVDNVGILTIAIGALTAKMVGASVATALGVTTLNGASLAVSGLLIPLNLLVAVVGVLTVGLGYAIVKIRESNEVNLQAIETYNKTTESMQGVLSSINDLKDKQSLTTQETARLKTAFEELKAINPSIVDGINEQTLSYNDLANAIKEATYQQKVQASTAIALQKKEALRNIQNLKNDPMALNSVARTEQYYQQLKELNQAQIDLMKTTYVEPPSAITPEKKISGVKTGGTKPSTTRSTPAATEVAPEKLAKERYFALNEQLAKNNILLEKNRALQENTTSIENKNKLYELEIGLLKERQKLLEKTNIERGKEAKELQQSLTGQGIKFDKSGVAQNYESVINKMIDNINAHRTDKDKTTYNQLKKNLDSLQKDYDRFYKLQIEEIPRASIEWQKLAGEIGKVRQEQIKQFENQLEVQKKQLKKQFDEEYDKLSKLSDLQEIADEKAIDAKQSEIEAIKKKNDEIDKTNERLEKELELQKALDERANILSQRNVRFLGANGFEFIADPIALKENQERIEDARKDLAEFNRKANEEAQIAIKEAELKQLQDTKEANKRTYDEKLRNLKSYQEQFLIDLDSNNLITTTKTTEHYNLLNSLDKKYADDKKAIFQDMVNQINSMISQINAISVPTMVSGGGSASSVFSSSTAGTPSSSSSRPSSGNTASNKPSSSGGTKSSSSKKYASGGLIDYTGMAWVDGSKTSPEVAFNQNDASKLWNFVQSGLSSTPVRQSSVSGSNGSIIIQNVNLPNIKDPQSFESWANKYRRVNS